MIKRCGKKLENYEQKLHLVEKFMSIKDDVYRIHELTDEFNRSQDSRIIEEIESISNQILEEL